MAHMVLVDDDASIARLLCLLLRDAGHAATYVAGSRHVLPMLRALQPDLLVLDVEMPEISGLQLLREVREDKTLHDVPVVMFSGSADPQVPVEARRLGATEYLTKGTDWPHLLSCLNRHLPESRPSRSAAPSIA